VQAGPHTPEAHTCPLGQSVDAPQALQTPETQPSPSRHCEPLVHFPHAPDTHP
jgi:hypothetical protein